MNDITALAQRMKGQAVNAPYYLAECMNCGEMMPSSKLVESKNYPDGDADCYCPHCNADDCDIADLGNGEEPGASAWNFQQKRIDALVEALEKAQEITTAAEKLVRCKGRYHSEQNYRALAALFGVKTPDLPQLESESRTVTVKLPEYPEPSDPFLRINMKVVRTMDVKAMTAAGIQVIEGEGQ